MGNVHICSCGNCTWLARIVLQTRMLYWTRIKILLYLLVENSLLRSMKKVNTVCSLHKFQRLFDLVLKLFVNLWRHAAADRKTRVLRHGAPEVDKGLKARDHPHIHKAYAARKRQGCTCLVTDKQTDWDTDRKITTLCMRHYVHKKTQKEHCRFGCWLTSNTAVFS